jgi:uncharacterized protein YmfQ (DUF2313 family)
MTVTQLVTNNKYWLFLAAAVKCNSSDTEVVKVLIANSVIQPFDPILIILLLAYWETVGAVQAVM